MVHETRDVRKTRRRGTKIFDKFESINILITFLVFEIALGSDGISHATCWPPIIDDIINKKRLMRFQVVKEVEHK